MLHNDKSRVFDIAWLRSGAWIDQFPAEVRPTWASNPDEPSPVAKKFDVYNDSLKFVGRLQRFTPNRNRLSDDILWKSWYEETQGATPSSHLLADLTFEGLYSSIAKYNGPNIDFSPEVQRAMDIATQWCLRHFRPALCTDVEYTIDDIIGANGPAKVEMDRSPGYPWNLAYQTSQDVVDNHREYLDWFDQSVRSGLWPVTFWNQFPKEEIRPAEKVQAGKIRSISGCAVELKLCANRVMLPQNELFYQHHLKTWSAVGINPYNLGWHRLYSKLAIEGEDTQSKAVDVKGWDSNFQLRLANCVKRVRYEALPASRRTPEVRNVLEYAYTNTFEGLGVAPLGEISLKTHGNNSGSVSTVVDNTLGHYVTLATGWVLECWNKGIEPSYEGFHRHVSAVLYGDDNTMSATSAGRDILCDEALERVYATFGWSITHESGPGWSPLRDVPFLSQRFHQVQTSSGYIMVPVPECPEKALCSMLRKGRRHSAPSDSYIRACGLMNVYYFDSTVRGILSQYLDHLEKRFFSDLRDKETARIRSARHTDDELFRLFTSSDVTWWRPEYDYDDDGD